MKGHFQELPILSFKRIGKQNQEIFTGVIWVCSDPMIVAAIYKDRQPINLLGI